MTSARTTVLRVEAADGFCLRLSFADGAVHEVDVGDVLASGGVFARIYENRSEFERVRVDPEFGTVEWPGGVDLDPDVLRGDQEPASLTPLPRRVIQPA